MLLPSLTDFLRTRWDMSAAQINLMIVRTSLSFLLVGTSIILAAWTIPLLIFGKSSLCEGGASVTSFPAMIVFSIGFGVRAPLLAVASTYISSPLETGKLYTIMTMTDALSHLVGDPLIQVIWVSALKVGGKWLIPPFLVLTVSTVLSYPVQLLKSADAVSRCHCNIMVPSRDFHRQHISQ